MLFFTVFGLTCCKSSISFLYNLSFFGSGWGSDFDFLGGDFLSRNYDFLDESSVEENTRLAFDVAEREFGIPPLMTAEELSSVGEPDTLSMVMYLSQFYQLLKESAPPAGEPADKHFPFRKGAELCAEVRGLDLMFSSTGCEVAKTTNLAAKLS